MPAPSAMCAALRLARQAVTVRAMTPEADPKIAAEVERQLAILARGVDEILPLEEFRRKLARSIAEGRPLRVKQGFDPTAPTSTWATRSGCASCARSRTSATRWW